MNRRRFLSLSLLELHFGIKDNTEGILKFFMKKARMCFNMLICCLHLSMFFWSYANVKPFDYGDHWSLNLSTGFIYLYREQL